MRVPAKIAAGDAVNWTDEPFTDSQGRAIAPRTHALAYAFRGANTAAKIDVASTVVGGFFSTTLSSVQTAALNVLASNVIWYWQAFATDALTNRYLVGSGQMLVRPNLSISANDSFDGRTQSEIDLAAVRAAISARASGGLVLHYTIGTRNLQREPVTALLALETRLMQKVARERAAAAIANGRGNPGKSFVRFTQRGT